MKLLSILNKLRNERLLSILNKLWKIIEDFILTVVLVVLLAILNKIVHLLGLPETFVEWVDKVHLFWTLALMCLFPILTIAEFIEMHIRGRR